MKIYNNHLLEITVFICGAVVMIFELVGSRVLGPYFGTSIFVWTSLIGIILGSLSLGYYLGGKIADENPKLNSMSLIIFLSAIFIGLTNLIKGFLLAFLQNKFSDIRLASVIASLILFSPASILLGMVSPYAAKLKLSSINTSGKTIGNLYAISTGGSIIGTFLSGFYLIPHFGTSKLLIILSIVLIAITLLLVPKKLFRPKVLFILFLIGAWGIFTDRKYLYQSTGFIDVDTAYNRIWIHDQYNEETREIIRTFSINNGPNSAMYLNKDDLVYEYTKYYNLAKHFYPDFRTTLMLGGAGYSYPKFFLDNYPEATIDVVEIDPMVTELAKKYFNLQDNPRLTIYHEDGRVFLNTTQKKYDVIFGDAFSSQQSLPYQLTTQEAVQKNFDILNENGLVIVNIISAIEGKRGEFLRAEYATYKSIFSQVYIFPVREQNNGNKVQNIIMVALKSNEKQKFIDADEQINEYLQHLWREEIIKDIPILTDDFAPVSYYINKTI